MKKLVQFRSALIFGGAGFVGSNWAYHLLRKTDANVHIFDNVSRRGVEHNLRWLRKVAPDSSRLKITIGDIRNRTLVEKAVQTATEIYHFAAQVAVTTSVSDPRTDFEVNVGGTFNILEAARMSGRAPFLFFTSTNKVYGHLSQTLTRGRQRYLCSRQHCVGESQPLDFYSPYGCSKGAADQYVHDYARIFGIPTVVFRMSCIAGPRQFGNEDQGWMAHFLYSALQENPIYIYGDGHQVRDVLCVEDLVRAIEGVRANMALTGGQVYNVGGGLENSISLLELVDEIERMTGKRLHYELRKTRPGDQPVYITDYSKLQQHIGWKPSVSVRETLKQIYDWSHNNQGILRTELPHVSISMAPSERIPEAAS